MREDLIANALADRFRDLCQARVGRLKPENFNDAAQFVSQVREQLRNASFKNLAPSPSISVTPNGWLNSDLNCLDSLQALAVGRSLRCTEAAPPSVESFIQELNAHKRNPGRRFELLTERYSLPMNFALANENRIREHVLERLMVQDRAQIEMRSVNRISGDDLLLKLNLIDALNYYYELLSAEWVPSARHSWLLASYFGLYARALAVWILKQSIAHSHTLEHAASGANDL
jgi:hypothetical protein